MKPFKVCPHCQDNLVQNHRMNQQSKNWWEEHCCRLHNSVNPCPIEFRQHYKESFADEELQYIHFQTQDFNIYCYFERDHLWPGKTYVYHKKFPRGETTQKPFLIVKNFPINFENVELVNQKFKKFVPFE